MSDLAHPPDDERDALGDDDERDALGDDDEPAVDPVHRPPTLEADEADLLDQRREVPVDDEHRS